MNMDKSDLTQQNRALQKEPLPTSPSSNDSQTVYPGGLGTTCQAAQHHLLQPVILEDPIEALTETWRSQSCEHKRRTQSV